MPPLSILTSCYFCYFYRYARHLHSFPTRRSSDLLHAAPDNAQREDLLHNAAWIAAAVHAEVGLLIEWQALLEKLPEARLIAKQGSIGHGDTAFEEDFNRAIEPDYGAARTASLRSLF